MINALINSRDHPLFNKTMLLNLYSICFCQQNNRIYLITKSVGLVLQDMSDSRNDCIFVAEALNNNPLSRIPNKLLQPKITL